MRVAWVVLLATSTASADPGLFEYSADTPVRPARVLIEAQCDVDVGFRGAIVEVEMRQRIANTGPDPLAATEELVLPEGAQLTGFAVRDRTTSVALPVPATSPSEIKDPEVIGADPAIAKKIGSDYHLIVQPIARDGELVLITRWSTLAEIRGGGMHVVLPRRTDAPPCRGHVHATPGPGATVAQLRADHVALDRTGAFDLGERDLALEVDLAFAKPTPIAWVQREPLGDGLTAQAVTVLAPPVTTPLPPRVMLLIDRSRSMELVGAAHVEQVVNAIAAVLPPATQLEAILYDHKATRVFGDWRTPGAVHEIDAAIDRHAAGGGSDLAGALAMARSAIGDGPRTTIVAITDGVLAGPFDTSGAELHTIVLDPFDMRAQSRDVLVGAIAHGGSYVELAADDLDQSLAGVADWLRPAWFELAMTPAIPDVVLAGGGFVRTSIERGPKPPVLRGRGFTAAAREAPHVPIAQLVLARATDRDFIRTVDADANEAGELDHARHLRWRVADRHPVVDGDHALAVLSTSGRVAHDRQRVVAGGGSYTRTIELEDPPFRISMMPTLTHGGSALDRSIIQRLLVDQLQPRAFTCYEHALGHAPTLAGTATMQLDIARGEVTRATIGGLGDAAFDACFLEAAYAITPPMPTLGFNSDDRSLVNYALSFTIHDQHPLVIPGDADSSTRIDIDAIQGGVARPQLNLDTHTPLGTLRPVDRPQ